MENNINKLNAVANSMIDLIKHYNGLADYKTADTLLDAANMVMEVLKKESQKAIESDIETSKSL